MSWLDELDQEDWQETLQPFLSDKDSAPANVPDQATQWVGSVVSAPLVKPKRTSRRRNKREQIAALYEELLALNLQKMALLARQGACATNPWKQRAVVERSARVQPEREQMRLRRRVDASRKMTKRVRDLLKKQTDKLLLAAATQRCMHSLPEPEDPFVFRRLVGNLDHRQSRLARLLNQQWIPPAQVDSSERLETCLHADGAGLEAKTISVQPFSVESIIAAMNHYMNVHPQYHASSSNGDVFMKGIISSQELQEVGFKTHSAAVVHGRCVVRVVQADQNRLAVIYENMGDWYLEPRQTSSNKRSRKIMIHESGWAVVDPLAHQGTEASVIQYGVSTNFYASDGVTRQRIDAQTGKVLNSYEAINRNQLQFVENYLIDSSLSSHRVS